MKKRIREHILQSEAECHCGCGKTPSETWLDMVNVLIEECGFPIPITSMVRCSQHNRKVGGSSNSPHLLVSYWHGAADLACIDPQKRMKIIEEAMFLYQDGCINHIEICDLHVHIASVPENHPYFMCLHWGKSHTRNTVQRKAATNEGNGGKEGDVTA